MRMNTIVVIHMKNFSITSSGYSQTEVNQFVDIVIARLEKLVKDNNTLLAQNKKLTKEIETLKEQNKESYDLEAKLNKAIIAVQETSDRMKELARRESAMIIEDAKRNANAIVHEALINAEKTENQTQMLRKNIKVYKNRVKSLLQSQLEIAEELDKTEI